MQIVYFSNFLNHHQKLLADELYVLTNHQFIFVEMAPMYGWLKKGGYTDYSNEPYVLCAWESAEKRSLAAELALTSDVAVFGGPETLKFQVNRAKNSERIAFEISERWLKRGFINIISPNLLRNQWYYHTLFYNKPYYKLCASAFCATDQYKLHSYIGKCYKWGYFTKVEARDCNCLERQYDRSTNAPISIMWCSRFIKWKHPELPVLMSKRLKDDGYKFHLDMYGGGVLYDRTVALVNKLGLQEQVRFCGNVPNDGILMSMRQHDIFLLTSDCNEGWGAVANEAMSNGCVLVGSNSVGSTPYLIDDGVNGLLFNSSSPRKGFGKIKMTYDRDALLSLTEKVKWLLNHPLERRKMADEAYATMSTTWSAKNAAISFMKLIDDLMKGGDTSIFDGPCSKAIPLH